jgi:hypothetical protein
MLEIEGPLSYFSTFGTYIGARALVDIQMIKFVYISPVYPIGEEGGLFTRSNNFYLPSRRQEEGGGGGTLCMYVLPRLIFCLYHIGHTFGAAIG